MKKKIMPLVMIVIIAVFVGASFSLIKTRNEPAQVVETSQLSAEPTSSVSQEQAAELTVPADSHYLLDKTSKITKKQAAGINEKAKAVYDAYSIYLLIFNTGDDLTDTAEETAGNLYDINVPTDAAVILLKDTKNVYIYRFGRAANLFSDEDADTIYNKVTAKEKYIDSFYTFISTTGSMLKEKGVQPIPAERLLPRLVDNADLLTDSEESDLLTKLDEISERQQMDVVIVTVNSLDGKTETDYADDFYDYNGYGFDKTRDGVLLLIDMGSRNGRISTCGKGKAVFTDAGQDYIIEEVRYYLSDGYYYDAFSTFADLCDDFITQAETDEPYDVRNMPKADFPFIIILVIALVVGFIIALIVVSVMKSELKTVRARNNAVNYTVPDSLCLTRNQDLYLYHVVTKRARPKDNDNDFGGGGGSSSHTSSSGSDHGGSSFSF